MTVFDKVKKLRDRLEARGANLNFYVVVLPPADQTELLKSVRYTRTSPFDAKLFEFTVWMHQGISEPVVVYRDFLQTFFCLLGSHAVDSIAGAHCLECMLANGDIAEDEFEITRQALNGEAYRETLNKIATGEIK